MSRYEITYGKCLPALTVVLALCLANPALAGRNAAPFVGITFGDLPCRGDSVGNGSGPWDYLERYQYQQSFELVERHHFTPQVEMLRRGQTQVDPLQDILFTLTYWPNHHRALNSLSNYARRTASTPARISPPTECWLQRAVYFSPNDAIAHMLYAMYLQRTEHMVRADQEYQLARKLAPKDLSIAYNHGLLLVEMENYAAAQAIADQVYAGGFPLPGLRQKLEAVR